jgi:hypothetical protein
LAHELGKPKPKTENPGSNTYRRPRINIGCKATSAAGIYVATSNSRGIAFSRAIR